jgi:flagellar hook-basal body complex protein FliE
MAGPILPISAATLPQAIQPAGQTGGAGAGGFQDVLSSAIQKVESIGQNASLSVERFLAGEGEELHTTILATQQAELSFDLVLQARNKVVSAYQEIMRMQM